MYNEMKEKNRAWRLTFVHIQNDKTMPNDIISNDVISIFNLNNFKAIQKSKK